MAAGATEVRLHRPYRQDRPVVGHWGHRPEVQGDGGAEEIGVLQLDLLLQRRQPTHQEAVAQGQLQLLRGRGGHSRGQFSEGRGPFGRRQGSEGHGLSKLVSGGHPMGTVPISNEIVEREHY